MFLLYNKYNEWLKNYTDASIQKYFVNIQLKKP